MKGCWIKVLRHSDASRVNSLVAAGLLGSPGGLEEGLWWLGWQGLHNSGAQTIEHFSTYKEKHLSQYFNKESIIG